MKYAKLFLVLVACNCQMTMAQINHYDAVQLANMNLGSFQPTGYLFDHFRDNKNLDIVSADLYAGVQGSPYLFSEWAYARIKLVDNRAFDSVLIKLNLFEKKVHFKVDDKKEMHVAVRVKEILITDSSSEWANTFFVTGYGDNENDFFQVISDGKKISLIKRMEVVTKEVKVFNQPPVKEFELQDGKLYLYSKKSLFEQNKNCAALLAAFGNNRDVQKYLATNNLKCTKEKDLKKLVEYYNSLE